MALEAFIDMEGAFNCTTSAQGYGRYHNTMYSSNAAKQSCYIYRKYDCGPLETLVVESCTERAAVQAKCRCNVESNTCRGVSCGASPWFITVKKIIQRRKINIFIFKIEKSCSSLVNEFISNFRNHDCCTHKETFQ